MGIGNCDFTVTAGKTLKCFRDIFSDHNVFKIKTQNFLRYVNFEVAVYVFVSQNSNPSEQLQTGGVE